MIILRVRRRLRPHPRRRLRFALQGTLLPHRMSMVVISNGQTMTIFRVALMRVQTDMDVTFLNMQSLVVRKQNVEPTQQVIRCLELKSVGGGHVPSPRQPLSRLAFAGTIQSAVIQITNGMPNVESMFRGLPAAVGTNAREEAFKVLCTQSRSLVHIPVMSSFVSQKRIGPTTHSVVSLVFPAPGLALGRINCCALKAASNSFVDLSALIRIPTPEMLRGHW